MPALHIFNPGHETAVLHGTPNYTPPVNVSTMTKDLAYLPLWYADKGDLVYVETLNEEFLNSIPRELNLQASPFKAEISYRERYTAVPWGLSPHILHYISSVTKGKAIQVDIPTWRPEYKMLTGRQSTIKCHQLICEISKEEHYPLPPLTMDSFEKVADYISKAEGPVVLKTPFSSSGRGILWIRNSKLTNSECNWIRGAIQKQGFISVEKGLNKTVDFAMEFYSDGKGSIRYEGLSLFGTEQKGAYTGNILMAQPALQKQIESLIGSEQLEKAKKTVTEAIQQVYSKEYAGYLGVDMILYDEDGMTHIHPCIEVNMRFTMGLVALKLLEHYVHPEAVGHYHVTFDKNPGEAFRKHLQEQKENPLFIKDGKISRGYLSLCPVTETTYYRAYLIV